MTAIFEQSAPLQVFQHDILEVVTTPPRMWRGYHLFAASLKKANTVSPSSNPSSHSRRSSNHNSHTDGTEESGGTTSLGSSVSTLVDGLLIGEHLRALLQDSLVRVKIPLKKRRDLIHENGFLHPLLHAYAQRHALAREGGGADGKGSGDGGGTVTSTLSTPSSSASHADALIAAEEYYSHRVGRVVGVLLKPTVAATLVSNYEKSLPQNTNTNTSISGSSPTTSVLRVVPEAAFWDPTLWSAPTSWQVVVHLGERVETFGLHAVSNTAMREEEHRVWMRTCIASASCFSSSHGERDGVGAASSTSKDSNGKGTSLSSIPYLMSGEAGVLKVEQLKRLRHILRYLKTELQVQRKVFEEHATGLHPSSSFSKLLQDQSVGISSPAEEEALRQFSGALTKKEAEMESSSPLFLSPPIASTYRATRVKREDENTEMKTEEEDNDNDEDEEEESFGGEASTKRKRPRHASTNEAPRTLSSSALKGKTADSDFRIQRLESLLAEKERHVQQFRQLLSQKDREVRDLLQQRREAEVEHGNTIAVFEEKVKQGEHERQQLLRAQQQDRQQHTDQLATASDKLVRMAQLTQKYKSVYEEALSLAQRWTEHSQQEHLGSTGVGRTGERQWTIESVLQTLKQMP